MKLIETAHMEMCQVENWITILCFCRIFSNNNYLNMLHLFKFNKNRKNKYSAQIQNIQIPDIFELKKRI